MSIHTREDYTKAVQTLKMARFELAVTTLCISMIWSVAQAAEPQEPLADGKLSVSLGSDDWVYVWLRKQTPKEG